MSTGTVSVVRRNQPYLEGEDIPIQAKFADDAGMAVAPDGVSGGTGPTITITARDGTVVVDAVVMTESEVGTYEHIWDTSSDSAGTGSYFVKVSAELSSETEISQKIVKLQ